MGLQRERGPPFGACLAIAALALCSPTNGQEQESAPPSEPQGVFFEDQIELSTLLELCSDTLGVKIEYDPSELEGFVRVQLAEPYTPDDLWQLANRTLLSRDLATVQPPGAEALRVVKLEQAAKSARIEEDLAPSRALAGFVSFVAPLRSARAEELASSVQLLLSGHGTVAAVEESNALILSDRIGHVRQALGVLEVLDAPEIEPALAEVELEHLSPVAMGTLLERVRNARTQVAGRDLEGQVLPLTESGSLLVVAPEDEILWWLETVHTFDRPEPVSTLHYTPRRFGLAETAQLVEDVVAVVPGSFRMVPDPLTGTLVVSASENVHEEVQGLFERLESVDWEPRKPVRTYPVRYRRVSEVLELLQELLDAGALQPATPERVELTSRAPVSTAPQGATAPLVVPGERSFAAQMPAEQGVGTVTLTADEPANRLIAFGAPQLLDRLGELIETLDVRHDQVLVEVLVVTLSDTQTRDFGVELQAIGVENGTFLQLASLFGLGSPDPASTSLPPATGTGLSGVVLNSGDFSAAVRALETLNEGRTLTIPKVLVNNNQEASLDSVTQNPFASTNASQTVATTSFGGTFDAGSSISVKPQVSDADRIVLEYTVSLSSFVGDSATPELPPPRLENKLQSVVTIPDGYTVVVGGLDAETDTEAESRVPLLADVPLLGRLFQSRSRTQERSRFFVFLRCSVMRSTSFEDLRYISARAIDEAGIDDGWPKMEPRIIR